MNHHRILWILVFALAPIARADEFVDGFLAPSQTVEVASGETGVLTDVCVREGDAVRLGQPIAKLEDDVLRAQVQIAEKAVTASGRLDSARAEFALRKRRLEKLEELYRGGNARKEEVNRAIADRDIALARVLTTEEEMEIKRLEFEKTQYQLERRTVLAPLEGVVLKLHKRAGEYLGPADPKVMTLVRLNPLRAVFAVPEVDARRLVVGQPLELRLRNTSETIPGSVALVAPVIDGRSGTIRVELEVPNPEGRLFSGEACQLLLDGVAEFLQHSQSTIPSGR